MNVFVYFFLTTAVVTAAPHAAPTSGKHQHKRGKLVNCTNHEYPRKSQENDTRKYLLKEIINDVNSLKCNLTEEILQKYVQNVFMNEECNCEMLCKAGNMLSAYNTSDLGLKSERDWRLPRKLRAYSEQNCTNTDKLDDIPLKQLLEKISICAKKEFADNK